MVGPIQPRGLAATYAPARRPAQASGGPAQIVSTQTLRAVLESLDAEAAVLRRAGAVARTADASLAEAETLLHRLTDPRNNPRAAVTRVVSAAAFDGVPLFDGRYSLRVGGGQLSLPDLVTSAPTRRALAALRGEIDAFRTDVVETRLGVVEATIQNANQTGSMLHGFGFDRPGPAPNAASGLGALIDTTA
ncbi:MAG: hypothetical protein AAFX76_10520 [Planctomycetota bacterium]